MPDTYQPTVIVPVGRTGGRTPPGADSVSSRPVNTTSTSSTSASSSSSSSSGASSASSKSKASSSSSSSGASSASSKSKASSSSSSSYRSTSVVPAAARHQCTRQRTMMSFCANTTTQTQTSNPRDPFFTNLTRSESPVEPQGAHRKRAAEMKTTAQAKMTAAVNVAMMLSVGRAFCEKAKGPAGGQNTVIHFDD